MAKHTTTVRGSAAFLVAGLLLHGAGAPSALAQASGGQPARVVGTVRDDDTGRGLEAAIVRLVGRETDLGRLTDGWGGFAFARVEPGVYELAVEHLGYAARSDSIQVVGGELLTLDVRMKVQPIELEPLVVTVERYYVSPRLWGFYDRADAGLGKYLTRPQIERRAPTRVSHMVAELPGVSLVPVGASRSRIVLSRYRRFGPAGRRGPCWPVVFLDGQRIRAGGDVIDDFVFADDVEGIEVYDGLATLPGDFADPDAVCGAIAVWTRRGLGADERGTPWTLWKYLAIPVVVVVSILLVR